MRLRKFVAAGFAAALVAAGAVALAPVAQAGLPPVVDPSIADGDPDSLRDVLENQITGGETVVLEAGATYVLDECGAGDVNIAADVTIEGNGATIQQTCTDRVLQTASALDLYDLTLTGGSTSGSGGAIDSGGEPLALYGVRVTGNEAGSDGGGIDTSGNTIIVDSLIADNKSGSDGGAVDESEGNVAIRIIRSTLSGNCAEDDGGAVSTQDDDSVAVINSTVTGNTADASGALDAVHNGVLVQLVYSDIVGNTLAPAVDCGLTVSSEATTTDDDGDAGASATSPDGANIDLTDGENLSTLESFGSVIAEPIGAANCGTSGFSTITSSGYNFSDDDSCVLDESTDKQNAGDPMLGALADNGGPTPTLLPEATSPLVNAIPIAACGDGDTLADMAVTTDQRGVTRPQETGCEIGSVEIEAPAPVVIEPTFTG